MTNIEKLARIINKLLRIFGLLICLRKDTEELILLRRGSLKKYRGNWSIGCFIGLGKCAHSTVSDLFERQFNSKPQSPEEPLIEQPWAYCSDHCTFSLEQVKAYAHLNELEKGNLVMARDLDLGDEEVAKNIYYFTVVRNPYSRIHGAWQECKEIYEIDLSFKEFLYWVKETHDKNFYLHDLEGERGLQYARAWWHFRPQLTDLLDRNNKVGVHFICKMESLDQDLNKCLNKFSKYHHKGLNILHRNTKPCGSSEKRSGTGYRQFYDPECRRLVEDIYWTDIDYFDYEF